MTKARAVKILMLSVREAEKCNPNEGTGIMVNLYALKEVLRAIGRGEDTRWRTVKRGAWDHKEFYPYPITAYQQRARIQVLVARRSERRQERKER